MTEKKNEENKEITVEQEESPNSRREFMKWSLMSGAAAACAGAFNVTPALAAKSAKSTHVKPGELDKYYGFWSGGHSGEIRVLGIPSMRELKRVPVFNAESAYGWGTTNFSKSLLKGKRTGDTHHVHLSYNNGTYDGKYAFVNDKAQARLARIRLDYMETDAIVDIPNCQGTHGIFPSRNKLDAVYCNSEYRVPLPNDGRDMDDPSKYVALHTCVDAKTMKVRWQVAVDGNLDLCATDYAGKYSMGTCYNAEGGVVLADMMAKDRDFLTVFNLERIEKAVKEGKGKTYGDSKVPVIDGRGKNPYVLYIPIPKSPHGVNVDPTGRYAVAAGKLSPTVSVVDLKKVDEAFEGKITPRDCVVAEPEVGVGPLHTAFDNKGNAYTSVFIDSVVTKWNIAKAVKGENPVIQKLDVSYQVGHINASMSETKDADGQWVISLNKFSKDRFLPVGPFHPENEQLIDITGDEMVLAHDGPTHPEPHDAVIVDRNLIRPKKIWDLSDPKFEWQRNLAKQHGVDLKKDNKVIRKGNKVYAFMTSVAPSFGLTEIKAKAGDEITLVVTNLDAVEDLCHGFCVSHHDVNFGVAPQEVASVTFTVDKKGVFWYYCPWFCHALHLEMRGRLIVS
jgi:nitrous-oxide reductase